MWNRLGTKEQMLVCSRTIGPLRSPVSAHPSSQGGDPLDICDQLWLSSERYHHCIWRLLGSLGGSSSGVWYVC